MKLDNIDISLEKQTPETTPVWKKVLFAAGEFIKTHKKLDAIVASVIILAVAIYFFIPVIPIGDSRMTNLGAQVRLRIGEVAKLKTDGVSVKIVHFTNDVCPEGQKCFGDSQKGVEYQMTIGGKIYAIGSLLDKQLADFDVETIESDYSSYSVIKIIRTK